jgi:hypothetical protein
MGSGAGPPPEPPGRPVHPGSGIGYRVSDDRGCGSGAWWRVGVSADDFHAWWVRGGGFVSCLTRDGFALTVGSRADRAIRTGWLHALPRLHLRPIDVLVLHGPLGIAPMETWF